MPQDTCPLCGPEAHVVRVYQWRDGDVAVTVKHMSDGTVRRAETDCKPAVTTPQPLGPEWRDVGYTTA